MFLERKSLLHFNLLAQGNIEHRTKTISNTTDPEWNDVGLLFLYFAWLILVLRFVNSLSNNTKAIVLNLKYLTRILEKMTLLGGSY